MDTNNWRIVPFGFEQLDSAMDTNNWRNEDSRLKIVNMIMDTLRRHMPHRGPDGMNELKKIALRFEDKIYTQAASQKDYLQRISLKMLPLESKAIQPSFPGSSPGNSQRSLDSVCQHIVQDFWLSCITKFLSWRVSVDLFNHHQGANTEK